MRFGCYCSWLFLVSWFCSWYSWSFCGFVVGLGLTFTNHDLFYRLPIFVHVFLHCVDHDFLSHLPIVIHDLASVDHGFLSYLPIDLANVDHGFLAYLSIVIHDLAWPCKCWLWSFIAILHFLIVALFLPIMTLVLVEVAF
jgi:hypothetical protein